MAKLCPHGRPFNPVRPCQGCPEVTTQAPGEYVMTKDTATAEDQEN